MQECKISLKDCITQAEGNIVSDMDGEKVMLSIKNGKYYNLGTIGGVIWDYIHKPIQVDALIAKLQNEYNVEAEQCKEDVLPFIEHLLEENLIVLVSE
ncbi:lasso peptide biosynthesis PqqD family chaperone [Bacillus sp. AGMB 02131]|uniref:Lasso peptide biosynthesis PqqD family chaperone n=1 Tax=Peribacillus faecalis TaxID=2772559 RepID=A0A927CXW5_9BACI|nr:lasso peptide biosynthesis PqqD family chaperone [Peribacillus faecalis]MBD3107700.1 lasso peptide biosynthesis PqqD family chaperone [Peribacillus faecalis]